MRSFIKTVNSPVDSVDLKDELDARDIPCELGDNGVYVNDEDYYTALGILEDMEFEEEDE